MLICDRCKYKDPPEIKMGIERVVKLGSKEQTMDLCSKCEEWLEHQLTVFLVNFRYNECDPITGQKLAKP
jgi:hypothetical protein